jgi:HEAT repeat protein
MIDTRRLWTTALLLAVVGATIASAQPAFQHLLEDLQSNSEGTRANAVRSLTTSGYPDAASAITPLLADPANSVQLEVINGLLTIALAPAPPGAGLATPLKSVKGSIAWSVFDAGPLAVLPRVWPPELITNLATTLHDDDSRVRVAAAGALGVIASPAMSVLSPENREALAAGMAAALRHPDVNTRQAVARAAGVVFTPPARGTAPGSIGDALIDSLNDTESSVRTAATEALGWVGEGRAEQALRDRLAFYGRGEEAETTLHALARIAGPASTRVFQQALGSREVPHRVMAVEGLGRQRQPTAVPLLTSLVQAEHDPSVLLAGAFAFYLLGERGNVERLVAGLVQPDLARQARAYLTELGADIAPELHASLRHHDPAVRRAVAEVLGLSGHAASEAPLMQVARGDSDPAVAEVARQATIRLRALTHGARTR